MIGLIVDLRDCGSQEALSAVGGNYTAGTGALKGVAYIPEGSSQDFAHINVQENAGRVWALEMATLHQAKNDLAATRFAHMAASCESPTVSCVLFPDSSEFVR